MKPQKIFDDASKRQTARSLLDEFAEKDKKRNFKVKETGDPERFALHGDDDTTVEVRFEDGWGHVFGKGRLDGFSTTIMDTEELDEAIGRLEIARGE